jgi:hypothetical protein
MNKLQENLVCVGLLASLLAACANPSATGGPQGAGPSEPGTLDYILSDGPPTGTKPSEGYYYVSVAATPDTRTKIPDTQCVDRSFWSFARKFVGITSGASAVLTAKITPKNDPATSISVPIFVTSATEVDDKNQGSNCQTKFWARPITFTYNSNLNPAFDVDFVFYITNKPNITATQTLINQATQLMSIIGTASGTPSALALKLADPAIKILSTQIDTELTNHWRSTTDLVPSCVN